MREEKRPDLILDDNDEEEKLRLLEDDENVAPEITPGGGPSDDELLHEPSHFNVVGKFKLNGALDSETES